MRKPEWWNNISPPVFLLVIIFAMSSWIDIYGINVEMPYLINYLPEGWALVSHASFAFVLANVGPLFYVIATKLCRVKIKEWPFIMIIIGVGMTMCLCLVFLWDKTAYIAGEERSIGFLAIVATLSLVDCTSSVVYIPYMARFKTEYLTAYFIGEGMGSLISSLVGLGQGVGSDPQCVNSTFNETTGDNMTLWQVEPLYSPPLFSVEVYFFFLFGVMTLSGISFLTLHLAPFCKKEYDQKSEANDNSAALEGFSKEERLQKTDEDRKQDNLEIKGAEINKKQYALLLTMVICLTASVFGMLASIYPYSALPYGNRTYNLLVRLFTAALPIGAFLSLFHSASSLKSHVLMTLVALALVGYHIFLAVRSPHPPLKETSIGSALVVVTGFLTGLICQYTLVSISVVLKTARGKMGLMWCGVCIQVGSILGSVISFLAVNIFHAFEEQFPCV